VGNVQSASAHSRKAGQTQQQARQQDGDDGGDEEILKVDTCFEVASGNQRHLVTQASQATLAVLSHWRAALRRWGDW
jgi:hypothetical protein